MAGYYNGNEIKGVFLGTQNTNCLTHIPNDINLELDPLNTSVGGSPTNSSGVFSNFSVSNYLYTKTNTEDVTDIIFKAKVTEHKSYNTVFSSEQNSVLIAFNKSGKLCLNLADWHAGSTIYNIGEWTWCRYVWDGSKVYLYGLKDNGYTLNTLPALSSWNLEYSTSKTKSYFGNDTVDIGWHNDQTSYFFNGSIDITQSQIKIADNVVWQGGTGILTLKKGSKVYVPNGTTEQKYYKYTYETFSQPILSADGTMGGSSFAVSANNILSNSTSYSAWKAFNNVATDYWHSQSGFPAWIQFYNPKPLKISKIAVTNRHIDGSIIKTYGVSYSDDGTNFTEFMTGTFENPNLSTTETITIASSVGAHKYWRISSYSCVGSNSGYTAIAEIDITAQVQTGSVESTADDYDYIQGAGQDIFDEVVISSDTKLGGGWNDERLVFTRKDSSISFEQIVHSHSGNSQPTENYRYLLWYDTNTNFVKYSNDYGATWTSGFSLPIAKVTTGTGAISSIDQVFNGFGYIGHTYYMLPNVKFLRSNGLNTDGTYKNTENEYVVNSVETKTITYSVPNAVLFSASGKIELGITSQVYEVENTLPTPANSYERVYVRSENQWYYHTAGGTSWLKLNTMCVLGKGEIVNTKGVTYLTPNPVQPEKIGREISRIYKGSTLVYGYKPSEVLIESSIAGTYTLNLEHSEDYEVTIVGGGGGGGGSAGSHAWLGANGGSGAIFKGVANLTSGTYTIKVGEGGLGGNSSGANAPGGSNGTESSISKGSSVLITAGAGKGGHGTGDYANSNTGEGGILTKGTINIISSNISQNGATSSTTSVLGNNSGGGGASASGKAGTKGQNGYVKIVVI